MVFEQNRPTAAAYLSAARTVLDRVAATQQLTVQTAAELITKSIRAGGVVQAFGTGHSEGFAMEIAGRAGGLVPTNKIALRDVVILGDSPREALFDPFLERDPAVAHQLYRLAAPRPEDVFVIASNSGVNGCVVEMAQLVTQHGHKLIAVTSAQHTAHTASRHPSGLRLHDFADVVLDNGAPHGDALLPLPSGGAVCAISSISAALLAQMVVAEVVRRLDEAGEQAPIYLSANITGGDDHNRILEARYAGRIRRLI
ncbi:SIS domain-containing protein [Nonomuraea guangzhouensis]|uniref:SIS domain-containing protein n=1 Tax=Nonomuraea guangzhouensis TaxID=1291555 RepID=A0ABW4GE52_9ACTN|nr:SIS domain-containing protein [Nonomuraea guangzhouensis]